MLHSITGKTRSLARLAFAGLICGALVVPALADDDDDGYRRGWGWGWGHMMDGRGMHGPMMGFGPQAMLDRMDGRLAFLKTELKITGAQEAAWKDLAETIRVTAEAHNDMMRSMMDEMHDGSFFKKPLPERMQFRETHMEARLEQIRQVREAVEKLYAVLDDEQKEAANELVMPMMGMGMGPGMGMGYGRGYRGYGPGRGRHMMDR